MHGLLASGKELGCPEIAKLMLPFTIPGLHTDRALNDYLVPGLKDRT